MLLHITLVAVVAGAVLFQHLHNPHWGENASQTGSIEASMVSAIPLPPKALPVKDSVLTSEDVSKVPAAQPKDATQPPPKPTDVLIKGKTVEKAIPKATTVTPPKHPQPTPDTRKANSGDAATQLPQSISQLKNGTATITVEDRIFGARYAYYLTIVGQKVAQNYYTQEIDPRTSQGKSATLVFDIERDGSVANLRMESRSGSSSLDRAAIRAIQRIESFGPLPSGDHITIEDKFDYHQP